MGCLELLLFSVALCHAALAARRPNIIIFLVDDLGWGDLSAYGHPSSYTPNIQRMADRGLLLTNFYASSPICSPSRAGLLTGRYATRSGVYPHVFAPNHLGGLPLNETTIAEGLKAVGYATGMVGKWHLGVGRNGRFLPNNQGFDYYYGLPYSHDDCPCYVCFYPDKMCDQICKPQFVSCPLFECKYSTQKVVQQPVYLPQLNTNMLKSATSFIKYKAKKKKPFFLFYSFVHLHKPQYSSEMFANSSARGTYGGSLMEVDYTVGQVFRALKSAGVYNNTFVFLTSDNGPELKEKIKGGVAGPLRCGKGTTWEGGMRVPGIAWWPRKIRHGRSHQLASTLDLLPTIFNLAGAQVPQDRIIDGVDMAPILFKSKGKSNAEFLAYFPIQPDQFTGPYAIRWRNYKAHYYTAGRKGLEDYPDSMCTSNFTRQYSPALLFDLMTDPQELYPLDTRFYGEVLMAIAKTRYSLMMDMQWGIAQTLVGKDNSVQPCARPGCSPFPYCCRTDTWSETDQSDQRT